MGAFSFPFLPRGGKLWRLKYRFGGLEKKLALGAFPAVSLSSARQKRDEARELLAQGIAPGEWKKNDALVSETFEELAREWLAREETGWTIKHKETVEARLKAYIFPHIGNQPVVQLTAAEVLSVLRKIEAKGTIETAHRVKQICGQFSIRRWQGNLRTRSYRRLRRTTHEKNRE